MESKGIYVTQAVNISPHFIPILRSFTWTLWEQSDKHVFRLHFIQFQYHWVLWPGWPYYAN